MRKAFLAALGVAAMTATAGAQSTGGTPSSEGLGGRVADALGIDQNGSGDARNAQQVVDGALDAARQIKSDPGFADLVRRAKGIFVVPTRVKGAFGIGLQGGQGVLLKRDGDAWSDPAFLTLASISLGPQVGGEAGAMAFLLMTDKALTDFTQANNFSLNANAGLTIVNYSTQGQASAGKGDVIVWTANKGAFAGADVSATDITANLGEDQAYYGRSVTTEQILNGAVRSQAATALREALPG